jgi:hypothetical protein
MRHLLTRTLHATIVVMFAAPAFLVGQGEDIGRILSEARKALGGEKLAAVKTLAVTGKTQRTRPDGMTSENDFELLMELPDKFMKRDVVMAMGSTSIYRMSGFNGEGLINEMDTPPHLSTGGAVIRMMPSGSGLAPGATATPEQIAENNKRMLTTNKQEFARLVLGMFASSFDAYPLQFTYGGQAESADGKAHVVEVKGAENFTARLFLDTKTNLPLMLSWMEKEPLRLQMGPGRAAGGGGGNVQVMHGMAMGGGMSQAEREQMQKDMEAAIKDAEAKRRVVEYRLFYGDYKTFSGVKLPTRIQRMIDGTATDELSFDKVQVNAKIDPKKFQPTKSDKE